MPYPPGMSKPSTPRRGGACPLCGAPATPANRPFCSQGCRDRDLLAWLDGDYRVPGRAADGEALESPSDGLDIGSPGPL